MFPVALPRASRCPLFPLPADERRPSSSFFERRINPHPTRAYDSLILSHMLMDPTLPSSLLSCPAHARECFRLLSSERVDARGARCMWQLSWSLTFLPSTLHRSTQLPAPSEHTTFSSLAGLPCSSLSPLRPRSHFLPAIVDVSDRFSEASQWPGFPLLVDDRLTPAFFQRHVPHPAASIGIKECGCALSQLCLVALCAFPLLFAIVPCLPAMNHTRRFARARSRLGLLLLADDPHLACPIRAAV